MWLGGVPKISTEEMAQEQLLCSVSVCVCSGFDRKRGRDCGVKCLHIDICVHIPFFLVLLFSSLLSPGRRSLLASVRSDGRRTEGSFLCSRFCRGPDCTERRSTGPGSL